MSGTVVECVKPITALDLPSSHSCDHLEIGLADGRSLCLFVSLSNSAFKINKYLTTTAKPKKKFLFFKTSFAKYTDEVKLKYPLQFLLDKIDPSVFIYINVV